MRGMRWPAVGTLVLIAVTVALVGAREGLDGLGLEKPLSRLETHSSSGLGLALARVAALVLVLQRTAIRVSSRALCVVGLLASLAWSGLVIPFLVACWAFAVRRSQDVNAALTSVQLAPLAIALGGVAALGLSELAEPEADKPESLGDQMVWYSERGNLFQVRARARVWCKSETPPGKGCLTLARTSRELKQFREAKVELLRVAKESQDPKLRSHADQLLRELEVERR